MYSFGVLVFEVYTFGAFPYESINNDAEFISFLTSGTTTLSASLQLPPDGTRPVSLEQLLTLCVSRDPALRPTADEVATRTSPAACVGSPRARGGCSSLRWLKQGP